MIIIIINTIIIILIIIVVIIPVLSQSVRNLNGRNVCKYACNLAVIFLFRFKIKIGSSWHIVT